MKNVQLIKTLNFKVQRVTGNKNHLRPLENITVKLGCLEWKPKEKGDDLSQLCMCAKKRKHGVIKRWKIKSNQHHTTWFSIPFLPNTVSSLWQQTTLALLEKEPWAQLYHSLRLTPHPPHTHTSLFCVYVYTPRNQLSTPPSRSCCTQISFSLAIKHWVVKFPYVSRSPHAPKGLPVRFKLKDCLQLSGCLTSTMAPTAL